VYLANSHPGGKSNQNQKKLALELAPTLQTRTTQRAELLLLKTIGCLTVLLDQKVISVPQ